MGAEYVDASAAAARFYCRKFGLSVLPAKLYDGIYLRDRKIPMQALKEGSVGLPYEGTRRGQIFGQEAAYTKRLVDAIDDLENLPDEIKELDRRSVTQLLLAQGSAPRLVVAMPFKVLRDVEITPGFSAEKMRVINSLAYGHVMKVAMQYRTRFWNQPGSIGQRVFTDTRLRRIYDMSIDQPGPRGILMSFTSGSDAEKLGVMSGEARRRAALAATARVWHQAPAHWESAAIKYWNEDPWIRGSYSFIGVGQNGFREIARRREGTVHFAGEHTRSASMNGAIASGVRVASEITGKPPDSFLA